MYIVMNWKFVGIATLYLFPYSQTATKNPARVLSYSYNTLWARTAKYYENAFFIHSNAVKQQDHHQWMNEKKKKIGFIQYKTLFFPRLFILLWF